MCAWVLRMYRTLSRCLAIRGRIRLGIFTRIDEQGFTSFFTTHDVAVALQRADRNRFENQGPSSVFKQIRSASMPKSILVQASVVPRPTFSVDGCISAGLLSAPVSRRRRETQSGALRSSRTQNVPVSLIKSRESCKSHDREQHVISSLAPASCQYSRNLIGTVGDDAIHFIVDHLLNIAGTIHCPGENPSEFTSSDSPPAKPSSIGSPDRHPRSEDPSFLPSAAWRLFSKQHPNGAMGHSPAISATD